MYPAARSLCDSWASCQITHMYFCTCHSRPAASLGACNRVSYLTYKFSWYTTVLQLSNLRWLKQTWGLKSMAAISSVCFPSDAVQFFIVSNFPTNFYHVIKNYNTTPQRFHVSGLAFLSHLHDLSSRVIVDVLVWDLKFISVIEHVSRANFFKKYSIIQDAQLSQRDRAAGCVIVFAQSRRLEVGDNNLRHYRSIFNHCNIIGLKICRIPWKNAK